MRGDRESTRSPFRRVKDHDAYHVYVDAPPEPRERPGATSARRHAFRLGKPQSLRTVGVFQLTGPRKLAND